MTKIALIGASGRMGVSLLTRMATDAQWTLSGAMVSPQNLQVGADAAVLVRGAKAFGVNLVSDVAQAVSGADVVIDFSSAVLTPEVIAVCQQQRVPLLLATTGIAPAQESLIQTLAAHVPVLKTANTSLGAAVLERAVALVAQALPTEYQIEISEAHHARKQDAPSGTALLLGETAAHARGLPSPSPETRQSGVRDPLSIGYSSLRAGDIVGEHSVWFVGASERVELAHKASSRDVFAHGALHAAQWLVSQPSGRYRMADVLGLATP